MPPVSTSASPLSPPVDLYDEGAGAVWGSLSDEGGPVNQGGHAIPPYSQADAGGTMGIDFFGNVVGDMPPYQSANTGGIIGVDFFGVAGDFPLYQPVDNGNEGTLGLADGGAGLEPADYGNGYMGVDDVGQDHNATGGAGYAPADYGNGYGGVDDVGQDYNATGGAGYGPADYGGAYSPAVGDFGIDDVVIYGAVDGGVIGGQAGAGTGYGPADHGGAVWGTIADEGVYGAVGGLDDVADYGPGAYGGLDDVADYGAVIGGPADGGIDTGIGVNGAGEGGYGANGVIGSPAGDYGPGDYGPGDYGAGEGGYGANGVIGSPAGDYGPGDYGAGAGGYGAGGYGAEAGAGAGAGGTGTGGAAAVEVNLESIAPSFYEGPFTKRKLDRAAIAFSRTDLNTDGILESASIRVSFPDHSFPGQPYAILGQDFIVQTKSGEAVPSMQDKDGLRSVLLNLNSVGGIDTFYLVSLTDSDHEDNEHIDVVITDTMLHSVTATAKIGLKAKENTVLADGTGDLDIADLNEDTEGNPGKDIILNADDDNQNGKPDLTDSPLNLQDDDLVPLKISPMLSGSNDYDRLMFAENEVTTTTYFILRFPTNIRVYRADGHSIESGITRFKDDEATSLFVEGIQSGKGSIELLWQVRALIPQPGVGTPVEGGICFETRHDSVSYAVRSADLDIDSDNNQGLAPPQRSAWEDVLEAHDYGIGKIIYPTPTRGNGGFIGQVFTPVLFEIPVFDGDNTRNIGVKFEFPLEQGESGFIKIWTVPSNSRTLIDRGIEDGGQRITAGYIYTAEQLKNIPALWIQAVNAQIAHSTLHGARLNKPDDRIKMVVNRRDGENAAWTAVRGLEDEVKYMVNVNDDVFYPNLQFDHSGQRYWGNGAGHTGVVLRDSLATDGVYGAADLPQFGLELLDGNQMREIGIDESFVVRIEQSQASWSSGLRVGIYRDYLSPEGSGYILAFAGTDLQIADIIEDITQGLGQEGVSSAQRGYEPQYNTAMKIGRDFSRAVTERHLVPRTTGHSLGGGLATAASVASDNVLPANTFNAAGVHRNTLLVRGNDGNLLQPEIEKYAGSLARLQSGANITNFFIEFDPLTFFQTYLPELYLVGKMPSSPGRQVQLQGPFTSGLQVSMNDFRTFMNSQEANFPIRIPGEPYAIWFARFSTWLFKIVDRAKRDLPASFGHHKMVFVEYGLMVHQADDPASPISRIRTWDIFGSADPDK